MATENLTAESLSQKFTPEERQKVAAGLAANQAINAAMRWESWMDIGEAVRTVCLATQREMGGPDTKSKREWQKEFNRIYDRILSDLGFSGPIIDDPSVRSKLDACVRDRKAIEEWRRGINDPKLLASYNHPATVLRHYKASKPKIFSQPPRETAAEKAEKQSAVKESAAEKQINSLKEEINGLRLQVGDVAPEFVLPASFGEAVFTNAEDCAAAALRMMIDRGDNSEGEIAAFIRGIQIGYPRFSEEQLRERARTVHIPGKADERQGAYEGTVVETGEAI